MILSFAVFALTLQASSAAPDATPVVRSDVVVTGHRLKDTEKALKACLARHCPPDQDVQATLAHAENQFVGGDYKNARATLLASVGRNKRYAKNYPVPVSDLLRAQARVSIHLGESDSFRVGQIDSLDALRAGLSATDARVLSQRIEVADAFAQLGQSDEALLQYRAVAADARNAGSKSVEGYALLRRAILTATLADVEPGVYAPDAKRAIETLTTSVDPDMAPFKAAAELLVARRAIRKGDNAAVDRLVATYATPGKTPRLLYAPPLIEQNSDRANSSGSETAKMSVGKVDNNWVDVGFWIKPDGTVGDVDALRTSDQVDRYWVDMLKANIAKRRYSPVVAGAGDPGTMRVERYTRTAHWLFDASGTHLRQREAIPRTEMVDLTAEAGPTPSTPPGVPSTSVSPTG